MIAAFKGSVLFLFAITAASVVPCGGPKKSLRASSMVQIIFSYWSFEISDGILSCQKLVIGLDSFSNQRFVYLFFFGVLSLYRLSRQLLQYFILAPFNQI